MVKNQKGVSLVEMLIGVGLLGAIAIFSSHLLNMGKKIEKQALQEVEKSAEFKGFLKYLDNKNVDWRSYLPDQSFYLNNNNYSRVLWNLGDQDVSADVNNLAIFVDDTSKNFFRTAHSLENWAQGSKYKRVVFSRCTPSNIDAYSLTAQEAYALNLAPVSKVISKDLTRIYCCPLNSLSCTSNQIVNNESPYQMKTFVYSNGNLIVFPKKSDEYLAGLGFFQHFDKGGGSHVPQSYLTTAIVAVDRCKNSNVKTSSKKCSSKYLIKMNLIKGTALGVQDRGYIQVQ